jgi:hypothetical protein
LILPERIIGTSRTVNTFNPLKYLYLLPLLTRLTLITLSLNLSNRVEVLKIEKREGEGALSDITTLRHVRSASEKCEADEVVERIKDGSITAYVYDPRTAQLSPVSDGEGGL